jgi:hypothetical protein
MILFFIAVIFLIFLVIINKTIEGLTISDADGLSEIIFKEDKSSVKSKIDNIKSLEIKDDAINEILNDTEIKDKDKIDKLQTYICNLVNERNENPSSKYLNNSPEEKLSCSDFTKILNVVGVIDINVSDYNAKMNDIKSLQLTDKAFLDVINNKTLDDRAKFNSTTEDKKTLPNDSITSLTYEILNADYINKEEVN